MTATETHAPTVADQAKPLLSHAGGYASHRTISIGLRNGLIEALAAAPDGITAEQLAALRQLDSFYVSVWCRSALAAGVCTRDGDRYTLAPHMDTLLLDTTSPAYIGGVFLILEQHDMFDRFEQVLPTGERLWWDQCSPEWIAGVATTGTPFYTRLVPDGLAHVPGLAEQLQTSGRIVDTACGSGIGLVRLAEAYPACEIIGVDGDSYSIDLAHQRITDAGLENRVSLQISPLEEWTLDRPATLVINNISMHECRDIDRATDRVRDALEPGGWYGCACMCDSTIDSMRVCLTYSSGTCPVMTWSSSGPPRRTGGCRCRHTCARPFTLRRPTCGGAKCLIARHAGCTARPPSQTMNGSPFWTLWTTLILSGPKNSATGRRDRRRIGDHRRRRRCWSARRGGPPRAG
ncbi:class I SAM-dependent methyltransferase [Phytoactinopolyspora halophila]|uniref:class I SAM-dependent methyltransferase n=1 Tax=Phytoactinopolyspora halophila TaxID=1981511 RepID=UPI001314B051|nr:class I SAM-dependent methyltransferase [Phytoactinopolyspora halophila]